MPPFNSKKKVTKVTINNKKVKKNEKKSIKTACHYVQTTCHYSGFFMVKQPTTCVLMSAVARSYI